jgi:hypothetical protein
LARDDAGTGAAEALTNLQLFAILGTGTPSASTYLRGDGAWATVSAGVGGSTGSVDNAVLRADGTGGATLQASAFTILDNFTASPNATVNHASLQVTGNTTNVSVSIVPKGTGAFSLQVPDGTAAGGNARGANAVDLSTSRSAATEVASGSRSFVASSGGTASGTASNAFSGGVASANQSFAFGGNAVCSGGEGVALGPYSSATSFGDTALGRNARASGTQSVAIGHNSSTGTESVAIGAKSNARLNGSFSFATRGWGPSGGTYGSKQMMMILLQASTTGTTPAELFGNSDSDRLTIPSGKVCQFFIMISGSKNDGSAVATYCRLYALKNVGGTTSEIFAPQTLGTDTAAGTTIALTADNTNDSLKIECTGITGETWRWQAYIFWSEYVWAI